MKKDDLYIAILKYGKEHLQEGVTSEDLIKFLEHKKYEYQYDGYMFKGIFLDVFRKPTGTVGGRNLCFMKMEAYFQLLEYEELKEARQSSKTATWIAIVAIIISAGLAFASIILGLVQIFKG